VTLIYLVQCGDKWRSFVNMVLKFMVPLFAEISYLAVSHGSDLLVGWLVVWLVS
jgi:hypothetical protein